MSSTSFNLPLSPFDLSVHVNFVQAKTGQGRGKGRVTVNEAETEKDSLPLTLSSLVLKTMTHMVLILPANLTPLSSPANIHWDAHAPLKLTKCPQRLYTATEVSRKASQAHQLPFHSREGEEKKEGMQMKSKSH